MTTNTATKLQHELNSFMGLSIINLVCSALVLAFGAYFLMPNIVEMATTQTVTIERVGLAVLGAIAFYVAIRWMLSVVNIFSTAEEIKTNLTEHKKNNTLDDTAITGLIVNMTAAYRENKPTIGLMTKISKIAGACFVIAALYTLASIITGVLSGAGFWTTITLVANMAISLAVAVACFIIPRFFGKYSAVWDIRLNGAAKAEAELEKQLGATGQ
jgi:hypothetical protein